MTKPNIHHAPIRALLLSLALLCPSCHQQAPLPPQPSKPRPAQPSQPLFREVAEEVGLKFFHCNGATGSFYMPEIMGSGVALLDYDNDGDLDAFLVQSGFLDKTKTPKDARVAPPKDWKPGCRLFRNQLIETGKLRFSDVTQQAGVGHTGYGMGVAVGDYDNDGHADLYLTCFGHNVLFHNNGNGTFSDVTRQASVDDTRWSASAAFVDYDHDGFLDLFVCNYLDFNLKENKKCFSYAEERDYCGPQEFQPLPDRLFRNLGNGRFKDVTQHAGITSAGPGLGVACADFNGDGRVDIFVANDGKANFLYLNQGNGTFQESALPCGVAYNIDGKAQANMGVAVGDFDHDGSEDVFVTHVPREGAILYRQDGKGNFEDATTAMGLLQPTLNFTGFATDWFDYDNDGWLDLFIANGGVHTLESQRGSAYPFRERNQLFHNGGAGKGLKETTAAAGAAFKLSEVSRGAAFGDVDNDGDVDIVVSNNNGPARLLLNETGNQRHWLEVKLRGRKGKEGEGRGQKDHSPGSNRDGIGARVAVLRKGQKPLWRRCHTDGSYMSASDPRVHFGLGESPDVEAVEVRWSDGTTERWDDMRADRVVTLRQGSGKSVNE
jgi:hypothetical protein